jgi:hypothetical protein
VDHEQVLLGQVQALRLKQSPRPRRPRRARAQSRQSGPGGVPNCATPWRRRKHRMPSAQLSLPFGDAEGLADLVDVAVELAPVQ